MPKVAIVEDDLAIAQMYRLKFEAEGYQAEIAENGKLGLALCEAMQPDIVLLDLMMPEMNGDEMLQQMRSTDWGRNIRVIILTNVGEQEAPENLKQLNVTAFIVKADMTPRQVADLVKLELSKATTQPTNQATTQASTAQPSNQAPTTQPTNQTT